MLSAVGLVASPNHGAGCQCLEWACRLWHRRPEHFRSCRTPLLRLAPLLQVPLPVASQGRKTRQRSRCTRSRSRRSPCNTPGQDMRPAAGPDHGASSRLAAPSTEQDATTCCNTVRSGTQRTAHLAQYTIFDRLAQQYPGWSTNNPHTRAPPRACTPVFLAHACNNTTDYASPIGKHTNVSVHACLFGVHACWNMRGSMRASIACMLPPYNNAYGLLGGCAHVLLRESACWCMHTSTVRYTRNTDTD